MYFIRSPDFYEPTHFSVLLMVHQKQTKKMVIKKFTIQNKSYNVRDST